MCLNMNSMGSMSDGIFAEYAVVPEKALVKIKKHVPIKKAIIAEPLNCTLGGIKKLQVSPGSACVVLGGGPLGLCYAAMLKKVGAGKVIVSEMSELRSNKAYELGADVVVNPMKHSLKETVMENTDGIGADIVVDCVGSLLADCIEIVRPGGQILLFGMNRNATSSIHQIDITTKSLTVYGSYIGDYTLQTVADILDNNVIDLSALVTHEYKLEEFEDAIEKMRTQEAVKVIIYPNGKI